MTYDQFTDAVDVGLKDIAFPLSDEASGRPGHTETNASSHTVENDTSHTAAEHAVQYWMELLQPDTAKTLASYKHPHWGAYAAVTYNHFGRGCAAYAGCYFDQVILKDLLCFLCKEAGIPLPEAVFPVILKRGVNEAGREITYLFNYSDEARTVVWHGKDCIPLIGTDNIKAPEQGTVRGGDVISLPGWDFAVLESVEI